MAKAHFTILILLMIAICCFASFRTVVIDEFKTERSLIIITPCGRPENIKQVYESINFDYVQEWIIVYDTRRQPMNKRFEGYEKVKEYAYDGEGTAGHQQRNYALNILTKNKYNGLVYFLDDDNIIHPNFWNLLKRMNGGCIYSFDQVLKDGSTGLNGNTLEVGSIDTAQCVIEMSAINNHRFEEDKYEADGIFYKLIGSTCSKNQHIYFPEVGCYYNYLR